MADERANAFCKSLHERQSKEYATHQCKGMDGKLKEVAKAQRELHRANTAESLASAKFQNMEKEVKRLNEYTDNMLRTTTGGCPNVLFDVLGELSEDLEEYRDRLAEAKKKVTSAEGYLDALVDVYTKALHPSGDKLLANARVEPPVPSEPLAPAESPTLPEPVEPSEPAEPPTCQHQVALQAMSSG